MWTSQHCQGNSLCFGFPTHRLAAFTPPAQPGKPCVPAVCGAIASRASKGSCFPPTAFHNSRGVAHAPHPCKPALSKPVWIKELRAGCPTLIKTYTSGIKPRRAELPSAGAVHPRPQEFPGEFPCQLSPGSASAGCPKTKSSFSRVLQSPP